MTLSILWGAPTVDRQPDVRLVRWQVFELPDGSRHFCGYHAGPSIHEARVSSPIVKFSPETMTGLTRSGRSYRLEGAPGSEDDVDHVKRAWLIYNGLEPAEAKPVRPDPIAPPTH